MFFFNAREPPTAQEEKYFHFSSSLIACAVHEKIMFILSFFTHA